VSWLSTIPQRNLDDGSRLVLLEAPAGAARRRYLEEWAGQERAPRAASWYLPANADFGGPWAGVKELLRGLLPLVEKEAPELMARHDTELLHVLPTLKKKLPAKRLTLTDLAFAEEKVRNYPMDRAYRIVHGLIDFLAAWQERARFSSWTIVCDSYDEAGSLGGRFFRELIRRRGRQLGLTLVLAGKPGAFDAAAFPGEFATVKVRPTLGRVEEPAPSPAAMASKAIALMQEVAGDDLKRTELLPELIYYWLRSDTPEHALPWQAWAFAEYNHEGFYEDALPYGQVVLNNIDTICGQTVFTRWNLAGGLCNCYLALLQPERALEIVEKEALHHVTDPADLARIHYVLALIHARFLPKPNFSKAEEYIERGLFHLESDRVSQRDHAFLTVFTLNGLAYVRHRQGRPQEALDLCQSGFETMGQEFSPSKHRLHRSVLLYNTGQVHAAMGDAQRGIDYYSEAIEMDPNYSEYQNERGNLYLQLGRLDEAIADYHSAIASSPPYWEVWSNLGQVHKLKGQLAEAIAAYDRAIDIDPGQLLPWLGRAQALEAAGRPEAALADYSAALALDPKQPLALSNRAEILYSQGRLDLALEDLGRAIELDRANPGLYYNRSVALADSGDPERAAEDLRAYLRLLPGAEDRAEVEQRIGQLSARAA
jgi:tetratricopeptide (TPR) repeat protein